MWSRKISGDYRKRLWTKCARRWTIPIAVGVGGQKAVLRGAIAHVFLSERRNPGTDADGVGLMGNVQIDGTRAAGIDTKTTPALAEIGVIGVSPGQMVQDALIPEA